MNKLSTPLVSVIVPIYNVEEYLKECLDSIICQTYRYLEIILVNDGSTDQCGKICDEYSMLDNRIQVVHQCNRGLSAARNAGLDVARGEYISFIDSDDYLDKHFIAKLLEALMVIRKWGLLHVGYIGKNRTRFVPTMLHGRWKIRKSILTVIVAKMPF